MQLFCISYAGGNAYAYLGLTKHLDPDIQLLPLETPGRGRRGREPLLNTISALTTDLLSQMREKIHGPYAIFGHSLGAHLGNLVIRRLIHENQTLPRHLFVSGAAGPSRPRSAALIHSLPKEAFLAEVGKYGGLPKEILAHQELIDYFEPILRADFQAIETHVHQPAPPMNLPITAMTGSQDAIVTLDQIQLWQKETLHPLTIERFPGDHFFIFEQWPRIGEIISETLHKP
ncbi:MAG: thioesterase [Magnetococcales bacterium]|nr:thioesterase [Magnetococcales bacterium]